MKNMKFGFAAAVILASAFFAGCSKKGVSTARSVEEIKKSGKVVIAVFSDKKPFGYVDENGVYQGYDVYFGNRIAQDLGVKAEYVPVEAASRVEYLVTGKVDIVLANFTDTKERTYHFTGTTQRQDTHHQQRHHRRNILHAELP